MCRAPKGGCRLLIALLALVSQVALGAMVLPDTASADPGVQLDAVSIICRAGAPTPARPQTARHRHIADWAIRPLSIALTLPAVLLSPTLLAPSRAITSASCIWAPATARGPPTHTRRVRFPRGPPLQA